MNQICSEPDWVKSPGAANARESNGREYFGDVANN
jgi:hypothetical protein